MHCRQKYHNGCAQTHAPHPCERLKYRAAPGKHPRRLGAHVQHPGHPHNAQRCRPRQHPRLRLRVYPEQHCRAQPQQADGHPNFRAQLLVGAPQQYAQPHLPEHLQSAVQHGAGVLVKQGGDGAAQPVVGGPAPVYQLLIGEGNGGAGERRQRSLHPQRRVYEQCGEQGQHGERDEQVV